jgi:class 3 adenylate cyclase
MAFAVQGDPSAETQQVQLQVEDFGFQIVNRPMPVMETTTGDFIHVAPTGFLQQGRVVLEVNNTGETRCPLWVANFAVDPNQTAVQFEPFLSGKRLLTTQTFRDLFRSEVVQSEEGIGVKDITFLFTDLKGSTAMYDSIGDAKAYYLVRQHFDTLGNAVTRNNGAIVKTIGDAIMATFMNPVDAVKAGIEMIRELEAFNRSISQPLHLKVGIHRGHSIVVTLNDRLDYFGQTVNIAARVQGLADADEVYVTQEAFAYPGVVEVLAEHHISQSEVDVKGVSGKLSVHKITAHH